MTSSAKTLGTLETRGGKKFMRAESKKTRYQYYVDLLVGIADAQRAKQHAAALKRKRTGRR